MMGVVLADGEESDDKFKMNGACDFYFSIIILLLPKNFTCSILILNDP